MSAEEINASLPEQSQPVSGYVSQLIQNPAYLDELEARLKALLDGFREVLYRIERWDFHLANIPAYKSVVPIEHRHDLAWIYEQARLRFEHLQPDVKWVSRTLTLWFVEAHIHARLRLISRQLHVLSFTIQDQTDEAALRKIKGLSGQLEHFSQILFNWGRLKSLLLGPSALPALVAFISPFVLGGVALNLSSAPDAAAWFLKLSPWLRFLLLVFILQSILLIGLLIVNLGFHAKRAAFTGGILEIDLTMRDDKGETPVTYWIDVPQANFYIPRGVNIYELEKDLFSHLGIRKPIEFPADVWLNGELVSLWIGSIGATIFCFLVLRNPESLALIIVSLVASITVWIFTLKSVYTAYKNYRKRVSFGWV